MTLNEDFGKTTDISEEAIRAGKEEVVKAKLGDEAQDIDLSSISDEDLEKVVTDEDKDEALKAATGVENLDVSNLSDEEKDALLGKVSESADIDEIIECLSLVNGSEHDIVEAIHVHTGMKMEEAREVYEDRLSEKKASAVDTLYHILHEDKEEDGDITLMDIEPEGTLDNLEPIKEGVDYTGEAIAEEDKEVFEVPMVPAPAEDVKVDKNADDACAALEAQTGEKL